MLSIPVAAVVALSIPAGFVSGQIVRQYDSQSSKALWALWTAQVLSGVWAACIIAPVWLLCITVVLGWSLVVLGAIDALVFRLPDSITLPLLLAGIVVSYFLPDRDVVGHVVGAAIAFVVFVAVMLSFSRIRKRDGLGMGDAKLAAAAGAWLGWLALPSFILIACCAGFIWIGLAALRNGQSAFQEHIPFGVPLCLAIWMLWLYGIPNLQGWM
jgi:leader peptidase (prepilin peptidase) / N-methyltransferase